MTAEASGFQTYARRDITMELGRTMRLDIDMQVGQVTERVEVTGTPPMLESETSSVGQLIENKMIADMPLNGRRVGDLLGMVGGTVRVQGDVLRPRMAISGGRADRQQWLLDGVNSSNIALEIPQALFNPPVEAVQEIKVHQNAYSAELGNSSGGVVSVTTRSGTNRYTGMLYEYLRNDRFDARDFFAAGKPPLRWNVFGGVIGGPVIRNRTFFFSNLEFQRQRVGVTRIFTLPTELQRRGDFSQTTTAAGVVIPIFDPATNRPDPGESIPHDPHAIPGQRDSGEPFGPGGSEHNGAVPAAQPAGSELGRSQQLPAQHLERAEHHDLDVEGGSHFPGEGPYRRSIRAARFPDCQWRGFRQSRGGPEQQHGGAPGSQPDDQRNAHVHVNAAERFPLQLSTSLLHQPLRGAG
jgi:hypothetical protein